MRGHSTYGQTTTDLCHDVKAAGDVKQPWNPANFCPEENEAGMVTGA